MTAAAACRISALMKEVVAPETRNCMVRDTTQQKNSAVTRGYPFTEDPVRLHKMDKRATVVTFQLK